jgi:hypothetical protein
MKVQAYTYFLTSPPPQKPFKDQRQYNVSMTTVVTYLRQPTKGAYLTVERAAYMMG